LTVGWPVADWHIQKAIGRKRQRIEIDDSQGSTLSP